MTKKEQTINGVDVSRCYYYCNGDCKGCYLIEQDKIKLYGKCEEINDCHYKLLKRKEQECEELKERIKCNCFDPKSNNNRCISYNRIAEDYERDLKHLKNKIAECEKYEQALEEIEGLISDDEFIRCPITDDVNCNYFTRSKILDIINKAKGDNNVKTNS